MSPIYAFLMNGTLPTDKSLARKLRYRSARYTVINDVLYRRGFTTPYLKCITTEQEDYVLREIHGGVCGDHSGSRSLASLSTGVLLDGYASGCTHVSEKVRQMSTVQ
ncbi:unnamed protein product [Prunus armeniaca]